MASRPRSAGAVAVIPMSLPAYNVSTGYGAGWFGPLQPMTPVAPASVKGRLWDYPVGLNLNLRPRAQEAGGIGFEELRALARNYDLLRLVIETRKDQMERIPWTIHPVEDEFGQVQQTDALMKRAKEVRDFLRKPDCQIPFASWLRMLLEDMLVIDAATIYRRPTRGGSLYALEVIDGSTIKPLIDDWGRRPLPPDAAYQQIIKGLPASEYRSDELMYMPRNPMPGRLYGFSPVEQVMMTVNIALRRQISQLQYYTEGNIPEALVGVPETWTPDQIRSFQLYWDEIMEGNVAARRHAKFVPAGVGKTFIATKEPELKNVFDEWLARVVCFCFSISPQPFVAQMNRATAETANKQSQEEGLEPLKNWVKTGIDEAIRFGLNESDLEFKWLDEKETDPQQQAETLMSYAGGGAKTLNEIRGILGDEPFDDPAADMLMVKTGTGYVPINANTVDGKKDNMEAFGLDPMAAAGLAKPGAAAPGESDPKDGEPVDGAPDGIDNMEVGKAARAPFGGELAKRSRKLKPIRPDRPFGNKVRKSLAAKLAPILKKTGAHVAKQVRILLDKARAEKAAPANDNRANSIARDLSLDGLSEASGVTADELLALTRDTGSQVLLQLGVTDTEQLFEHINAQAARVARDHGAGLVGKRYVNGELIDNPHAEYSITETTRDGIRDTIASGLEDELTNEQIAQNIEDSFEFSAERADMIARTEVSAANSEITLESYDAAAELGINIQKVWLTAEDEDVSDGCEENADIGPIGLDEMFPSGDDSPPAHPNCRCAVSAVVDE